MLMGDGEGSSKTETKAEFNNYSVLLPDECTWKENV